jgi:hypothetical protein
VSLWSESRLGAFFRVFRLDFVLLLASLSSSTQDGEADCGGESSYRRVREEPADRMPDARFTPS